MYSIVVRQPRTLQGSPPIFPVQLAPTGGECASVSPTWRHSHFVVDGQMDIHDHFSQAGIEFPVTS